MTVYNKNNIQDKEIYGAGGGGKSGGGKARIAQEDPNNLQSNAVARLIDVIGEGECGGLVDGLKSVYIDNTPLQNEDGTYNFSGIEIDERVGLSVQDHVSGFNGIEATTDVSTEITTVNPVVRTITDLNADAVRITVQTPALSKQNAENGDLKESSVSIAIDVRAVGGNWTHVKTDTMSGKNTSTYQRAYRIELNGNGPWDIRVRRLTPDSDSALINDKTYVANYTTIIDSKLTYPNTAYIGIKVDAKQFGNSIPERSYDYQGLIVNVPDNYNPQTRQYSGLWGGNFKRAWTNNPAWIYYEFATNTRWGAGLDNVDKWSLYQIGRYCDEYVDDGYGSTEPRFTINTVFNTRDSVYNVLNSLSSAFRGMTYYASGSVTAVQDAPTASSRIFTNANVVDGEFKRSDSDIRTRHTRCAVSWNDPANNFKLTTELVEDTAGLQKYGIQTKEISAFGCTSRGQARRLGLWTLYTEQLETESLEFSVSIDNADIRPGDVISINDTSHVGTRLGGRLKTNNTATKLTLDKAPTDFTGENKTISVQMPNGIPAHKTISSIVNNVVTLSSALNEAPLDNATYTLSSSDVVLQEFRVLAVTDNNDNTYTVSAIEHDKNKYARVEQNLIIPDSPTTLLPSGNLAAPLDISVKTYTYVEGGTQHQGATVSWSPAADARTKSYIAEILRPDANTFETIANTNLTSADVRRIESGEYTFRVASVDSIGNRSAWSIRTLTLESLLLPVAPTSVDVEKGNFNITLIPISERAGQLFEFYRSSVALQTDFITANAVNLGKSTTLSDNNLSPDTTYFYYIRGWNIYGVSEFYPIQVTTDINPSALIATLTGEIRESMLYQSLNEEIEKISGPESLVDSVAYKVAQAKADTETFIVNVENTLTDDLSSLTERVDTMSSSFVDNTALVQAEEQARTDADSALATQINSVQANVDQNISTAISSLESQIVTIDDKTTANANAITTAQTQFDNSLATVQSSLNADIVELNGKIDNTANSITTVQSSLNDSIASVETNLETKLSADAVVEFVEDWSSNSYANWDSYESDGEMSIVDSADAKSGKILRVGNNSGDDQRWLINNTNIEYNPDTLYRVRIRARSTAGVNSFYCGFAGVAADGVTLVNISGIDTFGSQHYFAANAVQLNPTNGWQEFVGYVSGHALAGASAQLNSRSVDDPAVMHSNVHFVRPLILCNYRYAAGITEIDYYKVELVNSDIKKIAAQYTAKVDVNGLVGGFGVYNDGETIDAGFNVDKFYIGRNLNDKVAPFIVNNNKVIIDDAIIDKLLFSKLRAADNSLVFANGKLSANYINVDTLVVSKGQSKNFQSGVSGWQLTETGGQINFPISFSNVSGAGSLASKNSLSYTEIAGTKPPTNADNTGSHVAYDTSRLAGHSASAFASSVLYTRDRTNQWIRPGTTQINGNQIFTGDAYVDTLQIKGQAITIPTSTYGAGAAGVGDNWTTVITSYVPRAGAPVHVNVGCIYSVSTGGGGTNTVSVNARLLVNGGVVADYGQIDSLIGTAPSIKGAFATAYMIGAGWGTSTVQLQLLKRGGSGSVSNRYIQSLTVKR